MRRRAFAPPFKHRKLMLGMIAAMIAALIAALLALTISASPDRASERAAGAGCSRYAAPSGSDRGQGTRKRPFESPQRLVESLRPGQTGCLRGGVYDEADDGYVLRFERAGRPSARITVRSHPGERARLVGIVNVTSGADWVTLSDVDVEGDGSQNTIKVYAANVLIEDNDITNKLRGESCLILGSNDGAGGAVRTIVRRNRFFDCGSPANDNKDHAIYAARLSDGRIERNLFVNSAGKTIQLYPNSDRTVVVRNVIDGGQDTVRGGIAIGGDDDFASSDNLVERNIIAHAFDYGVYANWGSRVGSGNVVRSNCIWDSGTADVDADEGVAAYGNVSADPGFVDRERRDFRLRSGSRCLKVLGSDVVRSILEARGCKERRERVGCRPPGPR
jgi:hypothetical protein